jgi:hypothetical protein
MSKWALVSSHKGLPLFSLHPAGGRADSHFGRSEGFCILVGIADDDIWIRHVVDSSMVVPEDFDHGPPNTHFGQRDSPLWWHALARGQRNRGKRKVGNILGALDDEDQLNYTEAPARETRRNRHERIGLVCPFVIPTCRRVLECAEAPPAYPSSSP